MMFSESDIEYRMHTIKHFPSISFKSPLSVHLVLNLIWQVTPGGSDGEESACKTGNLDSVSGLGRSPGEGNGNSLQYSGLENSMNRGAWQAAVHGITKKSNDWATNTFITNWGWEGSSILLTRLFKWLCPVRVCKSCFLLGAFQPGLKLQLPSFWGGVRGKEFRLYFHSLNVISSILIYSIY